MDKSKIEIINRVIEDFFAMNTAINTMPAKDLMPNFIKAGVFVADLKGGLSIRRILRSLDDNNQLSLIPSVHPDRKTSKNNWYFTRSGSPSPPKPKNTVFASVTKQKSSKRSTSDEHYVLDLLDQILGKKGQRQHRFDFLVGDPGKNGNQSKLPVDAYYSELNLVVEYREAQHEKTVAHFDKPDIMTVSGVHRGEQRILYDERRRKVIPEYGYVLVEIPYHIFDTNRKDKIIRNETSDLIKLKTFIKNRHPQLLNL